MLIPLCGTWAPPYIFSRSRGRAFVAAKRELKLAAWKSRLEPHSLMCASIQAPHTFAHDEEHTHEDIGVRQNGVLELALGG